MSSSDPAPNSETPILDRRAPLPPAVALGPGIRLIVAIWLVILGAAGVCVALGIRPFDPGNLRVLEEWFEVQLEELGFANILLIWIAVLPVMLVIHEGGHILAGLCVGFRYRWLRIGPVLFERSLRPKRIGGFGAAFTGSAGVLPVTTENLAARSAVMVLGGPLASLVTGCAALLLPLPWDFAVHCFAAVSLVDGLSNLIPYHSRLGVSDGARLWMLVNQRERAERWQSVMKLAADLDAGTLPEALPDGFLAKATAVRDEMPDTVGGHALAYAAAFYRGEVELAARMLEICLRHSARVSLLTRQALMSDAAVFQARRRGRIDLAEQWLSDLPEKGELPWLRTRAEAAILQTRGDREGAARKLAELEATIRAFPDRPNRATGLILLERWRSELAAS